MPTSVASRVSMTSFKAKRTWSRITRPSSNGTSPTSPKQSSITPPSPQSSTQQPPCIHPSTMSSQTAHQQSPEQPSQLLPPQQMSSPTSPNQPRTLNPQLHFLRQIKSLLMEFEQIHKVNQTPLSDPHIRHIRAQIEKSMPRLYALQQQMRNHPSSEASRIVFMAEERLKLFPDVTDAFLRTLHPPEATPNHRQAPRFPSLYPASPYSSKPPLHIFNTPVFQSNTMPATPSNLSRPANYHYFSPVASNPHDSYAVKPPAIPSAVADHRRSLTRTQEMLLRSVHALSSNYRQPFGSTWVDAPAALSPMEFASMSASVDRKMASTPSLYVGSAPHLGGFAHGLTQYAPRQDMEAAHYSAWDGAVNQGGRYSSNARSDAPRSSIRNVQRKRSNSNER